MLAWIQSNALGSSLAVVCAIITLGYLIGRIRICGIELGTAGVLLVALVFGHFGVELPKVFQDLGLACFVAAVGLIAGPTFFRNFNRNAKSYVVLGAVTILSGAAVCMAVIKLCGIPVDMSVGLLSGALTSTPGLAAALEAAGSDLAAIGYGIAYPFGVISVVIFIQIVPKLLKLDMQAERERYEASTYIKTDEIPLEPGMKTIDEYGFCIFFAAVFLGILIGKITIPLPGGASFSLGTSGGALVTGLLAGHVHKISSLSLAVNEHVLSMMREFGLVFFLVGAGVQGGSGFVAVLKERGVLLLLYGALMAIVPMLAGFLIAYAWMKMSVLDTLGSICGGMTSTPALGTLINTSGTDGVITAYAATYPVALVMVVLACQFLCKLL